MHTSVQKRAVEARDVVLSAYSDLHRAHTYFKENWQKQFKADREDVITEFMEIYRDDENLQHAVAVLNHWIGIGEWKRISIETRLKRKRNNLFTYKN